MTLLAIIAIALGPTWASGSIPANPEEDQVQDPTGGVRVSDPLPQPGVWTHLARTPERRALVTAADPGPGLLADIAWIADKDESGAHMEFSGPGGVVVDKKHVFASVRINGEHHAVAIDRKTGLTTWSTPLPPPVFNSWASPAIDLKNGTVIYSVFDTLFALDRKDGEVVWTTPAETLLVNASPLVTSDLGPADRAFITNYGVVSPPGKLICVNVDPYDATLNPYQPGEVVWTRVLTQPTAGATPAYHDGVVYVATAGALDLTSGTVEAYDATASSPPPPLWIATAPGTPGTQGFYGGLSYSRGNLFAATYEFFGDQLSSLLLKIDAETGQIVWSAPANRTSSVPIPIGDGRVALSTGLFPSKQSDFGSRPSIQLFRDHGAFGELLWDSAIDSWADTNGNDRLDTGEYLAIGGWSHQPVLRVEPGEKLLYVGTIDEEDLSGQSLLPYDRIQLIDLNRAPADPGFVVDSATGYGSSPAVVGDALYSVGPEGLTRAGLLSQSPRRPAMGSK
ncbi:MAG: PQQ-binding-like beta-propeller repeat protein [Phycisphaerales bacterium JB059]